MDDIFKPKNTKNLRVIKTARNLASINKATENGFFPLLRKVIPSPEIKTWTALMQSEKTGKVAIVGDLRSDFGYTEDTEDYKPVFSIEYYPHQFESPFAAYLIPNDIKEGEHVFVEDLIEDFIGATWNQGNNYRLESCEAAWDGKDLKILYDPNKNKTRFMG